MPLFNQPVRDRLAIDTSNALDAELGTTRRTEPKINTFGSGWLTNDDLGQMEPTLHWGRIVDLVPMANAYRIQAEIGLIFICSFGGLTGLQPHGARSITTLPIGAAVLFVSFPQSHYGLIIAVDPDYITNPLNHRSDYIAQGSRSGICCDPAHDALITKMRERGGIPSWTAGRPVDSTGVGEWGAMTETGLGVFLDPFMAYMRVDEETGLFLFYHDQFTRLSGHNLQIRSAHSFNESLDDQVEGHLVSGSTPYYWESLGVLKADTARHRTYTNKQTQQSDQHYSVVEPLYDDQQSFSRHLKFDGYLGQGFKEMIVAPINFDLINRYSLDQKYLGLLNIQASLDGAYAVESAKRIYLAKKISIPVPKQRYRPEDQRGDNDSNYKFAGSQGDGEDHVLASQFTGDISDVPQDLIRASSILDLGAFTFNWQGLHPFYYHSMDWYLPEECDLPNDQAQAPISFCDLQDGQFLSAPIPYLRKIDHRLTQAQYYPNESYFVLLEDGGFAIGDGYGAEIKATGGNMYISVPGDIFIQPGKNLNVWSGWDTILRSFNSIDLTTTRRDIHIKAENNLMMLGGNNKIGGVLLEAKSEQTSYDFSEQGEDTKTTGILLKAAKSPIVSIAKEMLFQTITPEDEEAGGISFKSDCEIRQEAEHILSFINQSRIDFFPGTANEYWSTHALFGANVRVGNQLLVGNSMTVRGWIYVVDGHIASTESAAQECGAVVYKLEDENLDLATIDLAETSSRIYYLNTERGNIYNTPHEEELQEAIEDAEFSLRRVEDYRTDDFVLFENRWQQLARLSTGIPAIWEELPVETIGGDTYPHPGKEQLVDNDTNAWHEQDLTLYSIANGASADRETLQADYEDPVFGTTSMRKLNERYPIIRVC
jgi:hypothetical protein